MPSTNPQRVEIASIPKGKRAEIRIASQEYRGVTVIDIRVWHRSKTAQDNAAMQPTQRGITMTPVRAATLAKALARASKPYI